MLVSIYYLDTWYLVEALDSDIKVIQVWKPKFFSANTRISLHESSVKIVNPTKTTKKQKKWILRHLRKFWAIENQRRRYKVIPQR